MLAKNVTRARRAKGWTRRQLAEASSVHENTIFDIERGKSRDPGYFKVEALAKALGIPARELSGLTTRRRQASTETNSDDYGIVATRG